MKIRDYLTLHKSMKMNSAYIAVLHFTVKVFNNEHNSYPKMYETAPLVQ